MEMIKILSDNSQYFHIDDYVSSMFRSIGWSIIKGLSNLLNAVQGVINGVINSNNFFFNDKLEDFINSYKPILGAILICALLLVAYKIMTNQKESFDDLSTNILIAICVVILMPTVMIKLNNIMKAGVNSVGGIENNLASNSVISKNVVDLLTLDSLNFDTTKLSDENSIPEKDILNLNVNEDIKNDFVSTQNKELFQKKLSTDKDHNTILVDLEKSFWGLGPQQKYFRYSVNFFPAMVTLLVLSFTFIFSALKIARIIFELGVYKFLGLIFAFADIDNGKRIRLIIRNVISSYLVIFFICVIFKIYIIYMSSLTNTNQIINIVMMVAGSAGVIAGPSIIERLIGIDAGIDEGKGMVRDLGYAKRTVLSPFKMPSKISNKIAKKVIKSIKKVKKRELL